MDQAILNLSYRPVKIGWCIRRNDFDGLRKSLRLTHTLWGGRFNPLIEIDDESSANLIINQHRPDFLFPTVDDGRVTEFIESHKELPFCSTEDIFKIWYESGFEGNSTSCGFVDIPCILDRHIFKPHKLAPKHFKWSFGDPLSDIFRTTFGEFPTLYETKKNYSQWFRSEIRAYEEEIFPEDQLSSDCFDPSYLTINRITTLDLEQDYQQNSLKGYGLPGIYVGDIKSFQDLVVYWNLRALGVEAIFFPIQDNERLVPSIRNFLQISDLNQHSASQGLGIWHSRLSPADVLAAIEPLTSKIPTNFRIPAVVTPGKIREQLIDAPFLAMKAVSSSVPLTKSESTTSFQVLMPPKPCNINSHFQRVMLSINISANEIATAGETFKIPNIPEMNEYYGLSLTDSRSNWWRVRAQNTGFSILVHQFDRTITIRALKVQDFFRELFNQAGIEFKISHSGLLVARMLEQLGGLGKITPFKIPNIRDLIEKNPAEKWFSHKEALTTLSKPISGLTPKMRNLRFGQEKIESATSILRILLELTVLRMGVELKCPFCELKFWLSLDKAQTISECALCGRLFNITAQIFNSNWAYRTSGIFAYRKGQGGAVPVALTLSKLINTFYIYPNIQSQLSSWSCNLTELENAKQACEADLVYFLIHDNGVREILLAECKGNKEIELHDLSNLMNIANFLEQAGNRVYLLFSKLNAFNQTEIDFFSKAYPEVNPRIILFTNEELEEPFWLTDAFRVLGKEDRNITSLQDLAKVSFKKYLQQSI